MTTLAQPAVAGPLDYEFGAGAFAGCTDNALGVPSGTPGSGSDVLVLGRVDAGSTLTRQFSEHRLVYAFTASDYLRQSGGDILSNSLAWQAGFQPRAWLRLTTSLGATQGRLTSLDVASASAGGGASTGLTGPRPAAPLLYASADARQGLSAELSPRWRLLQSLAALGFWPLEANTQNPSSYSGELGLGLERSFARDGVSLNARGLAMQANQVRSQGVVVSPQFRSDGVEGDLGWRHTFTPVWNDYLSGGGMLVDAPAGSTPRLFPVGLAELQAHSETRESEPASRAHRHARRVCGRRLLEHARGGQRHGRLRQDTEAAIAWCGQLRPGVGHRRGRRQPGRRDGVADPGRHDLWRAGATLAQPGVCLH